MYRLATSVARLAFNLNRSYLLFSKVQTTPTIYIAAGSLQYQVNVGVKNLILILQLWNFAVVLLLQVHMAAL